MNSELNFEDDLSSFEDYLAEFDSSISFDSEICPVCGIKVSDNINIGNSPFVVYKSVDDETELKNIIETLTALNSPYRIEKRLDNKSKDNIHYIFDVLIPIKYLEQAKAVNQL